MDWLYRLKHLPRDARDTLFLLLVIAWIILPQVDHLPLWCSSMAALVLLWRGRIALRGQGLPSRWWLLLLLLLAAAATWSSHHTLLGMDAGVTFTVVLLALKTLEMHARRDAFVVFFLGFFCLLSNFFYSQSLLTAAAMVMGLLGLLTALVNHHMPVGRPPLLLAARTAGWMGLMGAPIMVVLFVLFPRVAPLWGMPSDMESGRSGLSSSMEVGSIAKVALDSSVAMRIRFEGEVPPQRALYFRGPVLSSFDGRQWTALRSAFPPRMQATSGLEVSGTPVRYELTLEGNNHRWLPLLDATLEAPHLQGYSASMTAELQWQTDHPIAELLRLQVQSYTQFRHGPRQPELHLQDQISLPPGYNPRTLAWAAQLRRDPRYANADAATLSDVVLATLRSGGYQYTLEPGSYGRDAADEFWFDRKLGFCEHIASAYVVLMRAMDIPARVVTGYQGGERNPIDGLWTVRQSDAHAWAEIWLPERGWQRVDPTAAVTPSRTGTAERLSPPSSAVAQVLGAISPRFRFNLRALWDAANNRWNQWVLNYSQTRQFDLLRSLGFSSPSWEDLSTLLLGLVATLSLVGAAWTRLEHWRQDPWLRLLHAAQVQARQAGLAVAAHTPPRQLAQALLQHPRSRAAAPAQQDELQHIHDWLLRLEAWRYAPGGGAAAALGTLRQEYRRLRWPQPPPSRPPTP